MSQNKPEPTKAETEASEILANSRSRLNSVYEDIQRISALVYSEDFYTLDDRVRAKSEHDLLPALIEYSRAINSEI